jgi:hypothetical protein
MFRNFTCAMLLEISSESVPELQRNKDTEKLNSVFLEIILQLREQLKM